MTPQMRVTKTKALKLARGRSALAVDQSWRKTQFRAEESPDHGVPDSTDNAPGHKGGTERHDPLAGGEQDDREERVEHLARHVDRLDPSIPLQTLEQADEREAGQAEQRFAGEEDEQQAQHHM